MPVIGIDQVPRNIVRPKWYEDYGYAQGADVGRVRDLLLAALLKNAGGFGQVPTSGTYQSTGMPRPQTGGMYGTQGPLTQQGTFTSPQSFPINPQGRVASGPQSGLTLQDLVQQQMVPQSAVNWQQPTRWGIRPDLDYPTKQADIAYKQAQTKSLTPEFQADQYRRMMGLSPIGAQPPASDNEFLRGLSDLSTKAQAGDEDAVNRIRMIRKLLQGG